MSRLTRSNRPIAGQPKRTLFIAFVVGVCASISSGLAVVTGGTSTGYGLAVDVDVNLAILSLNLQAGPAPSGASGLAPAPYNIDLSTVFATVNASTLGLAEGSVSADLVEGSAESNIDGGAGTRFVRASGGIENGDISVSTLPVLGSGVNVLNLTGTLSSSAEISGDFGALTASGTSTIEELTLQIGAVTVDLSAYVNVSVPPNTSVNLSALGIAGLSLVLNEQVIAGDSSSIQVNALHLVVDSSILGLGVDANIVLGHSEASLTAVPEPSWVGLLGVLAGTAIALDSRSRWHARRLCRIAKQ